MVPLLAPPFEVVNGKRHNLGSYRAWLVPSLIRADLGLSRYYSSKRMMRMISGLKERFSAPPARCTYANAASSSFPCASLSKKSHKCERTAHSLLRSRATIGYNDFSLASF